MNMPLEWPKISRENEMTTYDIVFMSSSDNMT